MKRFIVCLLVIALFIPSIKVSADDTDNSSKVTYSTKTSSYTKSILNGLTLVTDTSDTSYGENGTYYVLSNGNIEYWTTDGTYDVIPKALVCAQSAYDYLGEDAAKKIQAVQLLLEGKGYTNEAIASVLGNGIMESNLNPTSNIGESSKSPSDPVFGAYQTTLTNLTEVKTLTGCSHETKVDRGNVVCVDLGCQTVYALSKLEKDFNTFISYYNNYESAYNSVVSAKVTLTKNSSEASYTDLIPPSELTKVASFNDFMKISDASSGALIFMCVYERCGGTKLCWGGSYNYTVSSDSEVSNYPTCGELFIHEWNRKSGRPFKAEVVLTMLEGMDGTYEESVNSANNMLQTALKSGFYNEDDLGVYNKLTEQNIQADLLDNANRDNLSSDEITNLVNWENNIEQDAEDGGMIYWARRIVSIFGILLIIWTILIYIAFWFDRLNNIIDIDLLLILTLGKLRVSDTDDDCTFSLKDSGKGGVKTVNHRAILTVCIISTTFGVLVVSGVLYKILAKLVYAVLNFLS